MAKVKICGLRQASHIQQAVISGASHIGFVFYPPSPRAITVAQLHPLSSLVPSSVMRVGLFVNPTHDQIQQASPYLDKIQLHGRETPETISDIKKYCTLPIMKAFGISQKQDFEQVKEYESIVDWYLFDAKPPQKNDSLPGGNGISFDWSLLATQNIAKPWMLSGGLTCENVAEAVNHTKADYVDVSSGVEVKKGEKDNHKIDLFIRNAVG